MLVGSRSGDSPFALLPAALGVDKDEQGVSVRHGADLLEDGHVSVLADQRCHCKSSFSVVPSSDSKFESN